MFAKSTPTPWARLKWWASKRRGRSHGHLGGGVHAPGPERELPDQSPIAALGLHLFSSILLIAVTAGLDLETSYTFLISLYAYVINGLIGFLASGGLLYLKYFQAQEWREVSQLSLGRSRWTNSIPAWFYCLFTAFLLVASFIPPPPANDTQYTASRAGIPWYVVPTIGLSSLFWGLIWYGGLKLEERRRGEILINDRDPTIEEFDWDDRTHGIHSERIHSEWIMTSEVITRKWKTRGYLDERPG